MSFSIKTHPCEEHLGINDNVLFLLFPSRDRCSSSSVGSLILRVLISYRRCIMSFDLVIANGHIVDGTGNPWYKGDIGISNGKISEIGRFVANDSVRVVDAEGLVVSPGFIDIHTHSDLALLLNPLAESKIRQGVTTEVLGNCGISAAPMSSDHSDDLRELWSPESRHINLNWLSMADYLGRLEVQGIALNVATLVGHGTIRVAVMGTENRAPTDSELSEMKRFVDNAMVDGAFGLSTGLVYLPGSFSTTSEIIELCKVVAMHDGFYASHTRGERETIVDALKEAIEIGEKAGVRVQVSHNCPKYGGHGSFEEMSRLYEDARARGIDLTIDNDAHTDLNPRLTQVLPQWAQAGSKDEIVERLKDSALRSRIKREMLEDTYPGPGYCGLVKHGRWNRIFLFKAKVNSDLLGKSFEEIAKIRGSEPAEALLDIIIEEKGDTTAIFSYIEEDDIRAVLKHPLMMICSDGNAIAPYGVLADLYGYYPCCYGEFPYILQRYVREEKLLTLPEAIRKMTSFPAQKLGLKDRGLIRVGMWADIVAFNPKTVRDQATCHYPYEFPLANYPHQYPEGIECVTVNGEVVVFRGRHSKLLPGKTLRH
ncbi:MAG: D-aminoacylase [Candidatus Thorarchaeota archaeon]|nr:D-aminoacylase [Candidatus Thorarchaeota archaeon]